MNVRSGLHTVESCRCLHHRFVEQERIQANHRRDTGPAADETGRSLRHRGRRRRELAREDLECLLFRVAHADLEHDFARFDNARVSAVRILGADDFHRGLREIAMAMSTREALCARDDRFTLPTRASCGLEAADHQRAERAEAVAIGRADLVAR